MKIILGGYFETAFVRYFDELIRPERNDAAHSYYLCLNRWVPRTYFERAATFLVLAQVVIVPSIDWALASDTGDLKLLTEGSLGVKINGDEHYGGREWDDDTKALCDIILDNDALSRESLTHVSALNPDELSPKQKQMIAEQGEALQREIARHYLCRLLLQVRAAHASSAYLVLSEADCRILRELGHFLTKHKLPTPYDLPDLTGRLLDGENFVDGVLNFAPRDALSVAAVKLDNTVQKYAAKIEEYINGDRSELSERAVLEAMRETYNRSEAAREAEKVFEVESWILRPLHYIPVLGESLTLIEDVRDLALKWLDRKAEAGEWYLLGPKMAEISVKDYFSRKSNVVR